MRTCACKDGAEQRRCESVIDSCEHWLRGVVCTLLEAGMMPSDMAEAVKLRTRKRSRAAMLTRIELVSQGGYWLSRPDWYGHFTQADRLAKYTGFHVGTTIAGWMQQWYTDKGGHDLKLVTDSVHDVGSRWRRSWRPRGLTTTSCWSERQPHWSSRLVGELESVTIDHG